MKRLILIIAILVAFLSSCGIHNGHITGSALLSQANFKYITRSISGSSRTMKIFGIGGLGKDALVKEAKNMMLKENLLLANQAIVNVSVDWKTSFMLVVWEVKCTVTADVVEFK